MTSHINYSWQHDPSFAHQSIITIRKVWNETMSIRFTSCMFQLFLANRCGILCSINNIVSDRRWKQNGFLWTNCNQYFWNMYRKEQTLNPIYSPWVDLIQSKNRDTYKIENCTWCLNNCHQKGIGLKNPKNCDQCKTFCKVFFRLPSYKSVWW